MATVVNVLEKVDLMKKGQLEQLLAGRVECHCRYQVEKKSPSREQH